MSIRILNNKIVILFLVLCFTFFNWALFFFENHSSIKRIPFVFIIIVFFLFFLIITEVKQPKKIGYLFCLFLYFPLLDFLKLDFTRSALFFAWIFYSFLIIPWALSGPYFIKNLVFFTKGLALVFILIILIGLVTNYENLFFGAEHRLRFTSGLGNPGIISKLSITLFFMSLLVWLFKPNFFYILLCVLGLSVVWLSGMRGDMYALIASIIFFIVSSRPKLYYWSLYFGFLLFIACIVILFNIDTVIIDTFTSQRLTKMWSPAIFETEFLKSSLPFLFGIGNTGSYFDSNYIYFLVSYGLLGFFLFLFYFFIMYCCFHLKLFSKNISNEKFSRWGLSVSIMFILSGLTQPNFPSFFNAYGLILMPVLIVVYNRVHLKNN